MKAKPIVADHFQLMRAGLRTLNQAAVLTHVGRSGLQGVTVIEIADGLHMGETTVFGILLTLEGLKLVSRATRRNRRGRAFHFICTVKGWELLTKAADFSLFPDAMKELVG